MRAIIYYGSLENSSSAALLRKAAAAYTGCDIAGWEIAFGDHGKPFFSNHPEICFNLSHSGMLWGCAFSDGAVGFDLEKHRGRQFTRIADRYFSEGERRLLWEAEDKMSCFFALWTAKESYLKYIGTGLQTKLDAFDVTEPLPGVYVQPAFCPTGYSAHLCTEEDCLIEIDEL